MQAFLNVSSSVVAYGDVTANANPALKYVDWKRTLGPVPVVNPESKSLTLQPGETKLVFDGTRTTTIASDTQLVLTASILDPARYRFTQGTGTAPGFRTNRALVTSSVPLTLVANANGTLTMDAGILHPFSGVSIGDTIFVPGPTTGDVTAGFDTYNEGEWIVLGQSSSSLTLVRNGDFSGVSEAVTPATNAVLAYSASGVQVGDDVDLSAGFATSAQRVYQVMVVTATWFEVISAAPLAPESATPGVAGIAFYSSSKSFLRVESDQSCVVRVNGDTGNYNHLQPMTDGGVGYYEKIGPSWSLTLVNKSLVSANATVISAE